MPSKSLINRRYKSENVKTARHRKISSTQWLHRQINDPFVKEAKARNYRCRAAFKILEIDQKYRIFKNGLKVMDLGSAPGGWSQVVVKKVGPGNVYAIDLLDMEPIDGVEFIKQDFLAEDAESNIISKTGFSEFDVVMSDMAPNTSGDRKIDHLRAIMLAEMALDFSIRILKKNGVFISKIFHGEGENELVNKL
ncbi:ribosomal RNA large subunit methyltransferase E [Bacilli bacterium]|nr:ribosomal RNA large subunit methyltransferase E [Bacilli bacterium]